MLGTTQTIMPVLRWKAWRGCGLNFGLVRIASVHDCPVFFWLAHHCSPAERARLYRFFWRMAVPRSGNARGEMRRHSEPPRPLRVTPTCAVTVLRSYAPWFDVDQIGCPEYYRRTDAAFRIQPRPWVCCRSATFKFCFEGRRLSNCLICRGVLPRTS